MEVRLSSKRLGAAFTTVQQEKQFTFVVGKQQREHMCSLIQACFISGKVCRLVDNDSTIDVLRVLPDEQCDVFELIENLWNGESVDVTKDNIDSLSKLSFELENEELNFILVNIGLSSENVSVENCRSRINLKTKFDLDRLEELEFLSSNFFEFEDLSPFTVNELESVLASKSLKIESENSLLDSILGLVSRDESYLTLLRYVQFEYLDAAHLNLFFERLYPEHVDYAWDPMTKFITESLKTCPPRFGKNERLRDRSNVFEYNASSPLSAIIANLRAKCGGNPHEKGIMSITASSNSYNQCHQVVDYGWGGHWVTGGDSNAWIQFDFKDNAISLESYTIKSDLMKDSPYYLKQWKVEGSNDGSSTSWTELDSRNTDALASRAQESVTKHFTCSCQSKQTFRYIRLTQTGNNGNNGICLNMSEIEFFGTLCKI